MNRSSRIGSPVAPSAVPVFSRSRLGRIEAGIAVSARRYTLNEAAEIFWHGSFDRLGLGAFVGVPDRRGPLDIQTIACRPQSLRNSVPGREAKAGPPMKSMGV